ncbi:hypothetical protein HYW94_01915 [Candidatus Uhrbacteria bacterium]|nr:hypothetical protein [Candidatus Uhrbacteria bacterium]
MSNILITRPEHDHGTRYLSRWSEYIIQEAEKKGHTVIDLHRDKATRADFEGRVKKTNPALVVLHGHGSERSVTGHDNKALVMLGENETVLYDRITYAISCDSAAVLGREVAEKGNATYIGYTKSFVFNFNPSHINQPTRDSRAAQFLNASNQVSLALLKGYTAKEASDRSRKMFRQAILTLLSSIVSDPCAREDAKDLYWDMTHQVCLGNGEVRI